METVTTRLNDLELLKNEFPREQFANILHQLCRCPSMTSFASHRSLKSFEKISILQGKHLLSISCSHKPLINQMLAELTSYLNDQQSSTELLASTIELDSDSNCAIYSVNTAYLEVKSSHIPMLLYIIV